MRVFGEPMSFWSGMPSGMLLRSAWDACHIGYPDGGLTLDAFAAESGRRFSKPVPLDAFIDYGRWFQRRAVGEVDRRRVDYVERSGGGEFRMRLSDGEQVRARRVVIAAGIEAIRPDPRNSPGSRPNWSPTPPNAPTWPRSPAGAYSWSAAGVWRSRAQRELATVEYIGWFNHDRLHSALGYLTPAEHEGRWRTRPLPDPLLAKTATEVIERNGRSGWSLR